MKTKINGMEHNEETTVKEVVEMQIKKGNFEEIAEGFKMNITKEREPTAEEILKEIKLNPSSPSFFKNTKPIKESAYYNYSFQEWRKKC